MENFGTAVPRRGPRKFALELTRAQVTNKPKPKRKGKKIVAEYGELNNDVESPKQAVLRAYQEALDHQVRDVEAVAASFRALVAMANAGDGRVLVDEDARMREALLERFGLAEPPRQHHDETEEPAE
jgi:hypothetical protein